MLHASRPFRGRLRGLFLIPWPGLAAAVGQSCSLRAQTPMLTTRMLRAAALLFPPFLEVSSLGCASCAALCTLRWCGGVVASGIWLLGAAMQPLKVAGKHQACRASQQGAGDGVDVQHRAHLGPWMTEMDIPGTPGQHGVSHLGTARRNSLSGQG